MPGFSKFNHQGKEIIYVDYRGQSETEMIETASQLKEWLLNERKYHLRLVNISETFAQPRFAEFIRKLGKDTKDIPAKAAVVGITGAKKVLLMGYNRIMGNSLKPFDTEEEALAYLVSD